MLKRTATTPLLILVLSAFAFGFQLPGDWVSVSSAEGRFSVDMPNKPEEAVEELDSAVGKLHLHNFPSSDEVAYYLLSYGDYPTEPAADRRDAVLDGVRNGVVNGLGDLISETKITIEAYPGRELIIKKKSEAGDQLFTWRVYLVGRRLYQLGASAKDPKSTPPEIPKFLNSFRLTK